MRRYTVSGQVVQVSGDTFPLRQQLKSLGARFVPDSKTWRLPHSPEVIEGLLDMGFVLTSVPETIASEKSSVQFDSKFGSNKSPDLSVAELCGLVQTAMAKGVPQQFWLVAELTHVNPSRGHMWLELADATMDSPSASGLLLGQNGGAAPILTRPSLSGVIWSGVLRRLEAANRTQGLESKSETIELPLQVGLKVRILGHMDFRAEGGRLQVIIDDLDTAFTQGQLALNRERIVAELRKRGLIDLNKRVPFVPFPLRIALITADNSRARNDFVHELERSGVAFRVHIFDCRMQGESTVADVTKAIGMIRSRQLSPLTKVDVVVLTRGGGSRMDLRWFDDIEIAKAIATCTVPIITAIGHHDDSSIADLVAAVFEKTPTAAAQALVSRCGMTMDRIEDALGRASQRALRVFERERYRLVEVLAQIREAAARRLERERQILAGLERILNIAGRRLGAFLDRGYALIWNADRSAVLSPDLLMQQKPDRVWLETRLGARAGGDDSLQQLFLAVRIDYASAVVASLNEPHTQDPE
jgi:exodeoxyribonuclease VII large subunit